MLLPASFPALAFHLQFDRYFNDPLEEDHESSFLQLQTLDWMAPAVTGAFPFEAPSASRGKARPRFETTLQELVQEL